jgi:hypothetical protein
VNNDNVGDSKARDAAIGRLVLGTVNAPWKRSIDAVTLAALLNSGQTQDWLPHLATFFTEVRAELVVAFALAHGVQAGALKGSYVGVRGATGERNSELEALLQIGASEKSSWVKPGRH